MQPKHVTCKNCNYLFTGNYCNNCGEKFFTAHDKSVLHLFEEVFHFISHFEGKLLTTLKTILTKPGELSLDYCSGKRKKYYKPLSFFLLLMIIYLLFPVAKGLNMPLGYHINSVIYGSFAKEKVLALMREKHLSEEYVSEHFHTASEKVSKLLLLLLIPFVALWSWLLTYKKRDKVYFDHFIFCTEVNSFLVLWGFLILPLLIRLLFLAVSSLIGHEYFSDNLFDAFLIGCLCLFTFIGAGRFYGLTKSKSLLFTLLFTGFYIVIFQFVDKFLLFYISIRLVH